MLALGWNMTSRRSRISGEHAEEHRQAIMDFLDALEHLGFVLNYVWHNNIYNQLISYDDGTSHYKRVVKYADITIETTESV